jgi:hypothetical protein
MLQKYKEIVYGIFFGFGAAIIDTMMDARAEAHSFQDEIIQRPIMLLYRILFVFFGLALGWLLWQKNKRERDVRDLAETVKRFQQEYGKHALLLHANLQVLLTREDLNLSRETGELIGFVYQSSQELQKLAKEKLPLPGV